MSRPSLPPFIAYMTPQGATGFFRKVLRACGGGRAIWRLPLSFRHRPEAAEVAAKALETYLATARPWHWTRFVPRPLARRVLAWRYAGLMGMWERFPDAVGLCWNGFDRGRFLFAESARRSGRPCLFAELSPLPGFLTLDPTGVNFAGSAPRSPDFYREWAGRHPEPVDWRATGRHLTARAPRRQAAAAAAPAVDGPFVFVPLQVPGDSQIRYFGDWLDSVESMLRSVQLASASLPEGWRMVIKEHPSSRVPLGHLVDTARFPRCVLDNATDTFELVRRSSAVITINSSVGLQSFYFDKPVIVLGRAFFGFEPLVRVARSQDQLARLLAEPASLVFDAQVRERFMSYLVSAYYFPHAPGGGELSDRQVARLAALVDGTRDA